MRQIRRIVVVGAVAALFAFPTLLDAQASAPVLELVLEPVLTYPRSGAPVPLVATLTSRRNQLVKGHLEVTLVRESVPQSVLRSPPLSLAFGSRTVQLTLPAAPHGDSLELHARFVGSSGTVSFPPRSVPLASANRSLSLLVVTDRGPKSKFADFARSLSLERTMDPQLRQRFRTLSGAQGLRVPAWTTLTLVRPAALPDRPLALTLADVVAIDSFSFQSLSTGQLKALDSWTRGGGSLCVIPAPGLPPSHRRFLRDIIAPAVPGRLFEETEDGQLRDGPGLSHPGMLLAPAGLGHFALVLPDSVRLEPEDEDETGVGEADGAEEGSGESSHRDAGDTPFYLGADSREGRRLTAFLWKMGSRATETLVGTGRWPPRLSNRYYPGMDELLAPQPAVGSWELFDLLSSRRARPIPVWVIASILLGIVMLVGPADYYLLRAIRRRSWTWVTFPVVCIGATVITASLARSYLGSDEDRSTLVIVDLDGEGQIARESRIELYFSGTEQTIRLEREDSLVTPLFDARRLRVEGRYPHSYTLEWDMPRWEPVFRRTFSFEPSEAAHKAWPAEDRARVDWDGLADVRRGPGAPIVRDPGRRQGRGRVRFETPRSILDHAPAKVAIQKAMRDGRVPSLLVLDPPDGQHLRYDVENSVSEELVEHLSFSPRSVHPVVLTRFSPGGNPHLDDLPFGVAGTGEVFVVAVAIRYQGDLVLYRWFGKGE